MSSSLHSQRYQIFRNMLVQARETSGLTQMQVASKLGKPQSFVSKYEHGERRIDVAEFFELADVIAIDVQAFFEKYKSAISNF